MVALSELFTLIDEYEEPLRKALREYEILLGEYRNLLVSGKEDEQKGKEQKGKEQKGKEQKGKEQELLVLVKKIEEKQNARNEHFNDLFTFIDEFITTPANKLPEYTRMLHMFRRYLSEIPVNVGDKRFDHVLAEERWFCQDAVFRLEEYLKRHNVQVDPEPVVSARAPQDQFKNIKDKVLQMQREMEEELKSSPPEMHQYVKRIYRKAIDALLEQ